LCKKGDDITRLDSTPKIFHACGFPGVFNILLDGNQGAADEAVLKSVSSERSVVEP
jgi:hypothetical protein